tara:strand:+ start:16529 stop:17590 length:1062 start_codon:yes stop_codon:yes gene_type:complete
MEILENSDQKGLIIQLGKVLKSVLENEFWTGYSCGIGENDFYNFKNKIIEAEKSNPWFTKKMVTMCLNNWVLNFNEESLNSWLDKYNYLKFSPPKTVLVICAGNLPLVGWHDILCCIILKYNVKVKLSSGDKVLIPAILDLMSLLYPDINKQVEILETKPTDYDCVIATGSDNTNRYFDYYFGHVPNLLRKNRTSIAVIGEKISKDDLQLLACDVFNYFGLGCRSVTKLYIPKNFNIDQLFNAFFQFKDLVNHNKYMNNYDYNRSIFLLQSQEFLENGFVILKEDKRLFSPLSVLNYEFYDDISSLNISLESLKSKIQCRVGLGGIPFGTAQQPKLWDYADGVDTIDFLSYSK